MSERTKRPFGFLLFGLLMGLGAGMAVAKHNHGFGVEALILGPIVGVIAGACLERFY